jgi:microsomal dipeptidase-like Zn-dependent dipeptidase
MLDLVGFVMAQSYGHGGTGIGHKVGGHPQYDGWPRWDSVTHQAMYEDWLFRAVQGGLRLLVVHAVNSELMCSLVETELSSNDMEAVDRQLEAARAMEATVDDHSGGPGQGWYRIVESPQQARQVMEAGKLAVILGIEVDFLFGCREEGDLDPDSLRATLDDYYARGVRHLFPIHFANNGFGGTAYQNDLQQRVGSPPPDFPIYGDPVVAAVARTAFGLGWAALGALRYPVDAESGTGNGYERGGGWQNIRGLTEIGKLLIREMIARGMIIDIDHMSRRSRADTLDICEEVGYPVISGHTGFVEISNGEKRHEGNLTEPELARIRDLGGMVNIIIHQGKGDDINTFAAAGQTRIEHTCGNSSNTLVQAYQYAVAAMPGMPVGFGTDMNGFAGMLGPRFGEEAESKGEVNALDATFVAVATGTRLEQSQMGNKTFDFNVDGLAHIGMLPDLIADWQAQGLSEHDLDPLLRSAEGYVELWEAARDVPAVSAVNMGGQWPQVMAVIGGTLHQISADTTTGWHDGDSLLPVPAGTQISAVNMGGQWPQVMAVIGGTLHQISADTTTGWHDRDSLLPATGW